MKKKRLGLLFIILLIATLTLAGCGKKDEPIQVLDDSVNMGYVLTSDDGKITSFDVSGKEITSLEIGNNNSNFIYTEDQGTVYHQKIKDQSLIPKVIYALDKNKSAVTVVKIEPDKITKIGEIGIRDGEKVKEINAYNGKFFYAIDGTGLKAKKHSFKKDEGYRNSGIVDYDAKLPMKRNSATRTYIVSEDLTDEYKEALNLPLNFAEYEDAGIKTSKSNVIEIPYVVDDWVANMNEVYFFLDGFFGQYDLNTDVISIYYGTKESIKTQYIDGIDKKILSLSNLGENGTKSVIFDLEPKFMQVQAPIEINEGEPLDMFVDKDKYIFTAFRNMAKDAKTLSRIKVIDYETYEVKSVIPLEYVPTKILGKDNIIYAFNPHEEYFLYGNIESEKLSKYKTKYDNIDYTDIFVFDFVHNSDYNYTKDGQLQDKKGNIINEDGVRLNKENKTINVYGQLIDEYGRAINDKGDFIDRYNNIIDENGKIKKYVKDKDGHYKNSFGNIVDKNGEPMIQNKEGKWVPKEKLKEKPEIEGFYDENGNFQVSPEYLKDYPEAEGEIKKMLKEKEDERFGIDPEEAEKEEEEKVESIEDDIEDKEETKEPVKEEPKEEKLSFKDKIKNIFSNFKKKKK